MKANQRRRGDERHRHVWLIVVSDGGLNNLSLLCDLYRLWDMSIFLFKVFLKNLFYSFFGFNAVALTTSPTYLLLARWRDFLPGSVWVT